MSIACPASPMRPRRAVLLTPPFPSPAFLQNVAKSCICHTSEKSPVTPIIATDPKTRSRKSCVCHTCDPLPRPLPTGKRQRLTLRALRDFILLEVLTANCRLLAGLSPLECAVTSKHRVLPGFGRSCPRVSLLECALTKRGPRNPFRMRTYEKRWGGRDGTPEKQFHWAA